MIKTKKNTTAIRIAIIYFFVAMLLFVAYYYSIYKLHCKEGYTLKNQAISAVIFFAIMALLLYLIISREMIRRAKIEKRNLENQKKYQEIVQNSNSAIIKFNLKGELLFFNEHAEKLYGYKENEILGKNIFDLLIPHHNPKRDPGIVNTDIWIKRILKNIKTEPYSENWNVTKSGKRLFMGWTSKPIRGKKGEITGVISIGMDRTEEKIMLNRIKENELKFKQIFNSVNDSILIINYKGEIMEQNNTVLLNLGLQQSEIKTLPTREILKKYLPNIDEFINKIQKEGEVIFEFEFENVHNQKIPIEIRANKIVYEGQNAILAVGRNVLHKKHQHQHVLKAAVEAEEKERSRIARELHDSVSPILSTAKLYAQSIKDTKSEEMRNQVIKKVEESINESINSISEISNKLSPHILQNFGLVEAVKAFADKICETQELIINIEQNIHERLAPEIETTIYRVTTELLYNTLKYANCTQVFISFKLTNQLTYIYNDDGDGFDYKKELNQTKGMGLFNISNRVKSIGGDIEYYSAKGKGVKVKVIIPIEEQNE